MANFLLSLLENSGVLKPVQNALQQAELARINYQKEQEQGLPSQRVYDEFVAPKVDALQTILNPQNFQLQKPDLMQALKNAVPLLQIPDMVYGNGQLFPGYMKGPYNALVGALENAPTQQDKNKILSDFMTEQGMGFMMGDINWIKSPLVTALQAKKVPTSQAPPGEAVKPPPGSFPEGWKGTPIDEIAPKPKVAEGRLGDVYYHETSPANVLNQNADLSNVYVSKDINFAKGQGGNKGIIVEIPQEAVTTQQYKGKPGLRMMEATGQAPAEEIITGRKGVTLGGGIVGNESVKSIIVKPDANLSKLDKAVLANKWIKGEVLPEGTRYYPKMQGYYQPNVAQPPLKDVVRKKEK